MSLTPTEDWSRLVASWPSSFSKKITVSYCLRLHWCSWELINYKSNSGLVRDHSFSKEACKLSWEPINCQIPFQMPGNRSGEKDLTRFLLSWSLFSNGRDKQKLKHKARKSKYTIVVSPWALCTAKIKWNDGDWVASLEWVLREGPSNKADFCCCSWNVWEGGHQRIIQEHPECRLWDYESNTKQIRTEIRRKPN